MVAGLVDSPWEYPWSSAAFHAGEAEDDPLASRDGDVDEMIPDWRTFLPEPDEEDFAEAIRRETAAGRPLGDDRFVRRLEKRLGRKLARGRPGCLRPAPPVPD